MAKPILNYTTEISVARTVGELQGILAEAGARGITVEYGDERFKDDRTPSGISFTIKTDRGLLEYRLPVKIDAVLKILERLSEERVRVGRYSETRRKIPQSKVTREHAARVGWRVVKDWLEAQLALIEIGAVRLDEIMLPYQLVDGDKTIYTLAVEKGLLGLPKPKEER